MIGPADIDESSAPLPAPGVATAELDGEAVLLVEDTAAVHLLNPTATAVWSLLDGQTTIRELGAELAAAYGVEEPEVTAHLVSLLRDLGRQGLLDGVEGDETDAAGEMSTTTPLPPRPEPGSL